MAKNKPDIKKLISNIKQQKKEDLRPNPSRDGMSITIDYTRPFVRERDMRKESMDMGSHGAKEYFGGDDAGPV